MKSESTEKILVWVFLGGCEVGLTAGHSLFHSFIHLFFHEALLRELDFEGFRIRL